MFFKCITIMPIYEAEFLGDPKPIKRARPSKKQKQEEDKQAPAPIATPMEKPVKVRAPKTKKVKLDIPTPPSPVSTVDDTIDQTPIEQPKPKRQRKIKPVAAPPPSPTPSVQEEDEAEEPPVKPKKVTKPKEIKPKVIIDGAAAGDPPTWFKNYLLDEAKRRNEDKSKSERSTISEVKKTATETAHKKWNDGLTRDRVNNEVSSHMNRLYQQIHGRR